MFKWFVGSSAVLIGVAHIGVLGHLIQKDTLPNIAHPQVGERSSYTVEATRDGYTITYRGDDPTVMTEQIHDDRPAGFLGTGRSSTTRIREYTESGQGGGVDGDGGKLTAEDIACIEAAGGGRSQGAIVGGSIAAAAAPAVTAIPYVGWLAAGWMTLLGTDIGGDIGAGTAQFIRGC